MENNDKEKVLGIDLGTSNSVVSVLLSGEPEIIPSAEGSNLYGNVFPSYVAFLEDGEILVGELARRQAVNNPESTITAIKRKMGTDEKINIHGKDHIPQEISSIILKKIKKDAEEYIGEKIEKAIITVPAYFNDNERTATKDAGTIAGLDVIRLINEPTSASLAYGFKKDFDDGFKIMVYDFGGGTLDVTILNFEDGVFDVKSTSGDTKLGGIDIDKAIMDYVIDEFEKESNINLRDDEQAIKRLNEACENAKIELSAESDTEINLTFIAVDSNGNPKNLIVELKRDKLEELIDPILKKSEIPMKQALKDANLNPNDIDKLILVGGTTRIPAVQDSVEKYIGKAPEKGIDPMECVAKGAAIQGAILEGEIKGLVLLDVISQSLGTESAYDINVILIKKNTKIPTKKTEEFTTVYDYQPSVTCNVLQGESIIASENVSLGEFELEGIALAPQGVPNIDVTFEVDSNGIIHATAQDQNTGVKKSITIKSPNKLTEEEIQNLK